MEVIMDHLSVCATQCPSLLVYENNVEYFMDINCHKGKRGITVAVCTPSCAISAVGLNLS